MICNFSGIKKKKSDGWQLPEQLRKITNLKKLLGRKFRIKRSLSTKVNKNLTSNLQQIRDTAKIGSVLKVL
jgi:hypothetical protein